jgi:hypothetical protein|tara:strand:+ start:1668 stop:1988 length:321 start_codon:yes stop_codon:yes gene_type:complete
MKTNYLSKFGFTDHLILAKSYFKSLITFFGIGLLLSIPMCLMWNWLMPIIFGLPKLNILETFGLSILANMFMSRPPTTTETAEIVAQPELDEYYKMREELENSLKD